MLRIIYPALRWLGWALVLVYVAVVLALLGIRYMLLPNIERYTPYIEAELSALFDGNVELGSIKADWYRLNPRVEIEQLTLHDKQGELTLTVPRLAAVVSWRSVLRLTPQFVSLQARGVDLTVRRDASGQLWLMGRELNRSDSTVDENNAATTAAVGDQAARWLTAQRQIRLHDATLRWIDESRSRDALVLQDVDLKIRNYGRRHQFSLTARPAHPLGGRFDMRGNFLRPLGEGRPLALESGDGQLYVHIDDMRPHAWRTWIDWPEFLQSDRVSLRTWFDVSEGAPLNATANIQVASALWQHTSKGSLYTENAEVFARGPWAAFSEGRMDFSVQAAGIKVSLPEHYDQPLVVHELALQGSTRNQDALSLQLEHVSLYNDDIALMGELGWTPATGTMVGGYLNLQAKVSRAQLEAVHRYMPRSISHEVRDWLQQGLLAGQIRNAHVHLVGDPSAFPFDDPAEGQLSIRADYHDAVIDYLPEDENNLGWPRLDALQGHIELKNDALSIFAASGQVSIDSEQTIYLQDVAARIDDLRDDPILGVSGQTQGDGATYMAFLQGSDLNRILDYTFDKTRVDGAWQLPLSLTIPLSRSLDTAVAGSIKIADGSIQISPEFPPFSGTRGQIDFTHEGVRIPSLSARFLDSGVTLSGATGRGQKGLTMVGRLDAQALSTLIDLPGMARFKGSADYVATLTGIGDTQAGLRFFVTSDLKGMALDFPAPLDKKVDEVWPLEVTWSHGETAASRSLNVRLDNTMTAQFTRREASSDSYFDVGAVGVGRTVDPISSGLIIDVEHPVFDGDAWDAVMKEFDDTASRGQVSVFPEIKSLRVQSAKGRLLGLELEKLTYTVKQETQTDWRADISSTQTAGSLTWTRKNGEIQGPVQAIFHRLAFGGPSDADMGVPSQSAQASDAESPRIDDDLHIPAINLIIENLRLYGRDVGKLALVGVNEDHGETWRLEQLTLSSLSAHLEGRGVWRLRGPSRGLTLDAEVDVSDLGDYLDQVGFNDLLDDGAGMIEVDIDWHNLPWSFDVNDIDGQVSFELSKGRLSTMNSKSARLLELISLQSIRRLATLDLNPLELTKDGFPYDMLRGIVRFEHGRLHTDDYRITGPVGTIVLDGRVYLKTGGLDLQAVVVPNLDVSGAAIAAGVAINPVVGIGAFLTQWLLKAPLAAAMTAQYKIDGSWDEPEVKVVERIRDQNDP